VTSAAERRLSFLLLLVKSRGILVFMIFTLFVIFVSAVFLFVCFCYHYYFLFFSLFVYVVVVVVIVSADAVFIVVVVFAASSRIIPFSHLRRKSGNVRVRGSLSYVPQLPWIMNASVRENILFGREYEEKRYHQYDYVRFFFSVRFFILLCSFTFCFDAFLPSTFLICENRCSMSVG
jgi:hypothetical protein